MKKIKLVIKGKTDTGKVKIKTLISKKQLGRISQVLYNKEEEV